jgi:hypothetical protein
MPTYSRNLGAFALLPLLLAAAIAACGESSETDVIITRPSQGGTVEAGSVTVSVEVKKFDVVDKIGEAPRDGEGHVHFYIDVGEIPTVDGEPATTEEGTYHAQATTEFTWEDVELGAHTFAVQLVNNDHTPLRPPVIAQVTVEAEEAADGSTPTRSPSRTPTRGASPTEESASPTPQQTGGASPTGTRTASATPSPSPRPSPTGTP